MSSRPRRGPSGRGTAIVVATAGLTLTVLATLAIATTARERRAAEVADRADAATALVTEELSDLVSSAKAVAAVVAGDANLDSVGYADAVDAIVADDSLVGVAGVNLVEYVPAGQSSRFRDDAMARIDDFGFHPAQPTRDAGVITYVYPASANAAAVGFDTFTNPIAWEALAQARITDQSTMSNGLRIVQETDEQTSVVVYVPIEDFATGEFRGWISLVIRGQQFLDSVGLDDLRLAMRISDVSQDGSIVIGVQPSTAPFETVDLSRSVHLYGQTWLVEISDLGTAKDTEFLRFELGALLAGIAISALTTLLVWQIGRREELAEERVDRATADLVALNQDLMNANRVKDDFLAVVSHEFRTPLTVIKGSAEMLAEDDLPAEMEADLVNRIGSNANRLTAMVGDLLVAARMEAGKLKVFPQLIPIASTVDMVVEELGELAAGVENHLDGEATVFSDRFHFERILSNLLSNAYKYGSPPVVISGRVDGDVYELSVRDHGAGVPMDLEARLFGAFEQADSGPARRSVGVGLGLNIVQRLAELNGGDVVYRRATPGAEFVIRLPLYSESPQDIAASSPEAVPSQA